MNVRIKRSVQTFIESLTGAEVNEIQGFMAQITSNHDFSKAIENKQTLPGRGLFSSSSPSVGATVGEVLYSLCRKVKPINVIETGVASGISSSYILQSLEDNKLGSLYSIDMPSWESRTGWIIPDYLRHRWHLVVGRSSDRLHPLLSNVGMIDVFLHDSEHSYENMMWEFQTAWTYLRSAGILLSHNIDFNDAFSDFCQSVKLRGHKLGNLGGLVKP